MPRSLTQESITYRGGGGEFDVFSKILCVLGDFLKDLGF